MTENIELRSYSVRNEPDGDVEEYQEITLDGKGHNLPENVLNCSYKFNQDSINEIDFFTHSESEQNFKKNIKKKKSKKTNKSSNIMDVIASELASKALPISENVLEVINADKNYNIKTFLLSYSGRQRNYHHRRIILDSEYGLSRIIMKSTIGSPTFRSFHEQTPTNSQHLISTEYAEPEPFNALVSDFIRHSQLEQTTIFLDIELRNIKFKHHHNFLLEELLCVKLLEQLEQYETLKNLINNLSRDIIINRNTKDNLKKDFLKVSPNKTVDIKLDKTIRKYTNEMFQLKEKQRKAFKDQKEITHKIISLWSDIEMIREKFRHTKTQYNLIIHKLSLNNDDYKNEWNEKFQEEFTDMLAKIEYDYASKYIEYKETKKDLILNSKKIVKPKLFFDEDIVKNEVERLVDSIIQKDKIDFSLEENESNLRDMIIEKYVFKFKIYIDEVFVCESDEYMNKDNLLNIDCNEHFSIQILDGNNTLMISLLENEKEFATRSFKLSDIGYKEDSADFRSLEFIYDFNLQPTVRCVGSGYNIKDIAAVNKVRLKSSNIFKGILSTNCVTNFKVKWSENLRQTKNDAIKTSVSIGHKLNRLLHGIEKPNTAELAEIIGKLYGKNISNNESLIKTIKDACKLEVKHDVGFVIDNNSPEYIRLKLLHLRNSGGFTDVEKKMVPIHGSQISTEQLNCLHKTKEKYFDIDYLKEKETDMDQIELQRFISAKYMQKVNSKMMKNLKEHLMVKTQKDVVTEFRDFSLRNIFTKQNMSNYTALTNGTKHQILMELLKKEQEIYITVQKSFNLLDRSNALLENSDNNMDAIAGFKMRPLRPFVRVSYRSSVAQTLTAIGCHPTWHHTLKLCAKLEPLSSLHINIYDECKVNISEGSEDQSTTQGRTVHYRYYNKWLGTAQVPLFTVLSLGTVRGTFKISSPPIVFGYETQQSKESNSFIPEITQLLKKQTSYIALQISSSLSHLGGFQAYNQPLSSSVEDDYIIKHLNTFVTDYTNDFPNRNISLTFIDSAGRNKCVTHFLQPIPPPDNECFPRNPKSCGSALSKSSGLSRSSSSKSSGRKREMDVEASDEKESVISQDGNCKSGEKSLKTIATCLRYVALIPNYEVTDTHVVTLMGLELLKVLHGSPFDHSILLASYLLHVGIKCWVGVGAGLPRGRSSYVLVPPEGGGGGGRGLAWHVCDAVAGERVELRDVGCPMKTIDFLFDNENIWVNMQSSQDCENVSFDLSRSSDWQPVFDKSIFVRKQPIVNDSSLYSPAGDVDSLRQALDSKIRAKVQKWRPHMKTIWNRYCSGLLRDALPHWEYWAFNPAETKPVFSQKLKQLMVTYRIYGFPLNMPFVNTKSVLSAIKSTALHVTDDPNVEFGLGVEVYAYPNNVISAWVYLVSITRI